MRILDLAAKDLLQIIKDKMSAVFFVLMPLVFTVFFGILTAPGPDQDNRILVYGINQDAGVLSASLVSDLQKSETIRLVEAAPADKASILEDLSKQDAYGLLEIPPGYSRQLYTGEPVAAILTADSASQEGSTVRVAVQASTQRIIDASESARLAVQAAKPATASGSSADQETTINVAFNQALEFWSAPPVKVTNSLAQAGSRVDSAALSGYAHASPGVLLQFAIFGVMIPGAILVHERKKHTFQRLMTTPMSRLEFLSGHGLAFTSVVFIQQFLLIAAAQLFFGVDYLRQPVAVLLVMVAVSLMSASLGMLFGLLAKKDEQVVLYSLIAMFVLSAMGGAWFPLEVSGEAFSRVGHLLPGAWIMDAFQNITARGLGLESVLKPSAIILAFTLAFMGLSIWRFSKEQS